MIFRVLSYGGGLDSFALLLLMLRRGEPIDLVIFADVRDPDGQDPGEWPGTYQHIREVAMPLCRAHQIPFVWLDSSLIPIRASKQHPEGFRSLIAYYEAKEMMFSRMSRVCTVGAKVDRIQKYVRRVRPEGSQVEMLIGFEAGEEERAAKDPHATGKKDPMWVARFPLAEAGLCRCRCEAMVRELGLPVPRKSACIFCPFSSKGDWQEFARSHPREFERLERLEEHSKLTKSGAKLRFFFKDRATDIPLRLGIQGKYRRRQMGCKVCGAAVRASKEVGCGYLSP